MDPGPVRDALTLIAGVATGVLSAAFGVGGATISTPAIRLLGAPALVAVGTTLPSILPSAVTGTLRYAREHIIQWRIVAWTGPAGMVASVGGSLLSNVVPGNGHLLMLMTAALLGFTSWRMARSLAEVPTDAVQDAGALGATETEHQAVSPVFRAHRNDTPAVLLGIGVVAGVLSGLLGVGGGVVMVPAFTEIAGVRIKPAIASSLACVGLLALPGTITHAFLGDIDWRFALLLAVGVVPGARIGAVLAIRADRRNLRLSVAVFLGFVAVLYGAGEVISLAR
jgi:uncharacterized membrane protein YfcA